MSTEKREGTQPPTAPTMEQMLAQLLKAEEENKRNIDMLAKAIVEVNKKVEAKASTSPSGSGGDALTALANLLKPSGTTIEDLAKQAEGLNKLADSLDRFRNPSRIGLGEALLMRAGVRAIYPRYMTKAEIQRAEKALGVWESLEEAESGEHEHPE